jgi:hypothetical protein
MQRNEKPTEIASRCLGGTTPATDAKNRFSIEVGADAVVVGTSRNFTIVVEFLLYYDSRKKNKEKKIEKSKLTNFFFCGEVKRNVFL